MPTFDDKTPKDWQTWTWDTVGTTNDPTAVGGHSRDIIAEVTGTFGGGTFTLEGGLTAAGPFYTVKDIDGNDIAATAAGAYEVRTAWPFMQWRETSAGTGDAVVGKLMRNGGR